ARRPPPPRVDAEHGQALILGGHCPAPGTLQITTSAVIVGDVLVCEASVMTRRATVPRAVSTHTTSPVSTGSVSSEPVLAAASRHASAPGRLSGFISATRAPDSASTKVFSQSPRIDRKSTRLNSSHVKISYAVFCL